MAVQLVQTAAAGGPGAAEREAEPGTDLRVGYGGILGEQGDQMRHGGGRSASASRSAACRSARSSSSSADAACSSGMSPPSSPWPRRQVRRATRTIRLHSRPVVVASQPGSAALQCGLSAVRREP